MSTTDSAPLSSPLEGVSTAPLLRTVDLAVGGMTCASCVARVEKKLNKLDGVTASVNLATESAHLRLSADIPDEDLIAAVARAGYTARITRSESAEASAGTRAAASDIKGNDEAGQAARPVVDGAPTPAPQQVGGVGDSPEKAAVPVSGVQESTAQVSTAQVSSAPASPSPRIGASQLVRAADLRRRLIVSLILSVPLMVISMFPATQFYGWQWVVAGLAVPVVTWGAWPFHRAAAGALRHGAFTMDTLVSLGVIAATGWSLWALIWGGAGELGMRMSMEFIPRGASHHAHMYFESAAWVTTFLLMGRWAEARAKYRSGDALRALLELGATSATRVTLTAPNGSTLAVDTLDEEGTPLPGVARSEEKIAIDQLRQGDLFLVRPGDKIATDGVVIEGKSAVDASMLTGESVPVDVATGDAVTGATINTFGSLLVRATAVGEGTTLARIGQMVTAAQAGKAPVQRLADRISGVFVPAVMVLAVATVLAWLALGHPVQQAFMAGVAVLVIACPCALGLATPTAILVGSGRAARLGVVIKGPEILESTRLLDTIVLDKTGTITQGRMSVDIVRDLHSVEVGGLCTDDETAAQGGAPEEALRLAGALETASEHPVAQAIVTAARQVVGDLPPVADFRNHAGRGVSGFVDVAGCSYEVCVGRPEWVAQQAQAHAGQEQLGGQDAPARGIQLPDELEQMVTRFQEEGATAVVLHAVPAHTARAANGLDGSGLGDADAGAVQSPESSPQQGNEIQERHAAASAIMAVFAVRDTVRESSAAAIAALRELGVQPILLTGDNERAATHVAAQVGIDRAHVKAQVLPGDKRDVVAALQRDGHVVGMVGDGVNDAAALAQAGSQGIGFAMGTGTDVAIEAADMTLVRADLGAVVDAIRISRATLRIIKQNLFWAFAYNVAAIPLAAAGLLNPMIAGAAMACSSVIVVTNSLRLRRA